MAMTHVRRPAVLSGPVGATNPSLLARSNITGGAGWYNVMRPPTNIKTNPNYSSAQRVPPSTATGNEREEDSGSTTRPRSMVILGTSRSNKSKQKKRVDAKHLKKKHDQGQGRSKVVSNPDVRQSRSREWSNPDIAKHLHHDLSNGNVGSCREPRGGSASNLLDEDDLDRPEYERGLSSPDLSQFRKLKQAKNRSVSLDNRSVSLDNRSVSLDVLRRSHDCLRSGVDGTCKCTVKLYTPGPNRKISRKVVSGSISSMVGQGCYGQPKDKTISDSDVSSFFNPSSTVWNSSQHRASQHPQGQLNRHRSVDTSLITESGIAKKRGSLSDELRKSFFRPNSDADLPRPWTIRPTNDPSKDVNLKLDDPQHRKDSGIDLLDNTDTNTPTSNGYCKMNDGRLTSTLMNRSTSLPEPKSLANHIATPTSSGLNRLINSQNEPAPPKPPRSIINNVNLCNRATSGIRIARPLSEPIYNTLKKQDGIVATSGKSKMSEDNTLAEVNVPNDTNSEPSKLKIKPLPSSSALPENRQTETPTMASTQPSTTAAPTKSPMNYNYKPLYAQIMNSSNQWYTPYATSTTYFAPKASALSPGRSPTSYGYSSNEDKIKVMDLLDRYESSGMSNLGLSRKEMTNYLNSTKRQLGLKATETVNATNEMDTKKIEFDDVGVELSQMGKNKIETKSMDTFEGSSNTGENIPDKHIIITGRSSEITEEKENIKPIDDRKSGNNYDLKPTPTPTTLAKTADRLPSMVVFNDGITTVNPITYNGSHSTFRISPGVSTISHVKPRRETLHEKQHSTEKQTILKKETIPEAVMMTQTTFHVDGAITESPAMRRRIPPCRRQSSVERFRDDVNNNEGNKISTTFDATPVSNEGLSSNGKVVYSVKVPCYQMWRFAGALDVGLETPTELLQTGITPGDYDAVCPYLNDAIRHKQILATMDAWLHGSYLALFFVVVWLIGFVVCYSVGIVSHWSAGFLFLLAIFLISGVAFMIRSSKPKITNKLQRSLTQVNTMLAQNNLLATIVGNRYNLLGPTLNFVNFDISCCQKTVAVLMSDKRSEDLLLTKISRDFPCLMDVISDDLMDVFIDPEEMGRKVIAKDILMYFAASYLEYFLSSGKKFASKGKLAGAGHCAHEHGCLCDQVRKTLFETVDSPTGDTLDKLPASKPTLL